MAGENVGVRGAVARLVPWVLLGAAIVGGVIAVVVFVALDTSDTEDQGGILRVALVTFGAEVLDPSLDSQSGLLYHGHMFDHLMAPPSSDDRGGDGPAGGLGLLERWDASPSGDAYTLTLREGMRWHDGEEITSEDIAFSIDYYSRESASCGLCSHLGVAVESARGIDRYRSRLQLTGPDVLFMAKLGPLEGDTPLLAKHHWDAVGTDGFASQPLGSGPWRFVERVPGERIAYEANADYWNRERTASLDGLDIVEVAEAETRVALLRAGQVDMAPVGLTDIVVLREEGFKLQGPRNVIGTALRFFMSYDPAFLTSKKEFREALILGIDLPSVIGKVYPPGAASPGSGTTLSNSLIDGPEGKYLSYSYDPERARQLLIKAGYRGEPIRLLSVTAYGLIEMPQINELLAREWERLGVNVEVMGTDWPAVQSRSLSRPQEFDDLAPAPLFHGASPVRPGGVITGVHRYMGSGEGALLTYHDPASGDRIEAEIKALYDTDMRERWLGDMTSRLRDEYWAAPLVWRHEVYALNPDLEGWEPTDLVSTDLRLETIRRR